MEETSINSAGLTVIENTPRCSPCPFNEYQNIAGGKNCIPCPENHITFEEGRKSKDECIGEYINSIVL